MSGLKYVKEYIREPEKEDAKTRYKNNMIKAKSIWSDSIKDQLIPHVSKLETAKEMFEASTRLYERKNTESNIVMDKP